LKRSLVALGTAQSVSGSALEAFVAKAARVAPPALSSTSTPPRLVGAPRRRPRWYRNRSSEIPLNPENQ
jgi:hypothetical protein